MKLKSSIYVLLLLLFVMPTHAQNNHNKEKNKNKKEVVQNNKNNKNKASDTYKKEKDQNDDNGIYKNDDNGNYKKDKVKSNNGNGNAYGNNKKGLEGREFGQERARQARLQNQKRKQKFQETIVIYERRLPTFRERLQNARILLEQQKPKLTVANYEVRRERLVIAEQKMTLLEKTILIANTILN